MTSNETMSAVRTFLESYRDAFERLDAAAIADHFVSPGNKRCTGADVVRHVSKPHYARCRRPASKATSASAWSSAAATNR
jgi:hypothetical protein